MFYWILQEFNQKCLRCLSNTFCKCFGQDMFSNSSSVPLMSLSSNSFRINVQDTFINAISFLKFSCNMHRDVTRYHNLDGNITWRPWQDTNVRNFSPSFPPCVTSLIQWFFHGFSKLITPDNSKIWFLMLLKDIPNNPYLSRSDLVILLNNIFRFPPGIPKGIVLRVSLYSLHFRSSFLFSYPRNYSKFFLNLL